jgi:DNA topoisomerase-1
MSTLVIVESPSKCKKIESYLGTNYKVIASFGHLRYLSKLDDIHINDNFNTTYSIIEEPLKLKQIEKIRTEINSAIEVIIATDDDREGEAIGWHICELFNLPIQTTKRIIFHEITYSALQYAILNPTTLNLNLITSQKTRQILDLLVGFNISPFLWNAFSKKHHSSLSAGRCQTPALRLVYENYLDIKSSPGKIAYNISGYFTNLNLLFDLNTQFTSIEESQIFLEQAKTWIFLCNTTSPKKTIKKAPDPLTTSNLQQLASNELHLSPKDTMKYAQQLYESGLITYMRTDSKNYSQEFINSTKTYIETNYGNQYISLIIDNVATNNSKEAHEAIRPVSINIIEPSDTDLCPKAIKLYKLIWTRTIQSCMPSAQYNSISAKIYAPLNTEFIYKTEQPIFLGWQIIHYKENKVNDYQYITNLRQGIEIKPKKINASFTITELKSHFTEARLVQLLEEKGIGRPSTFASLIDKIQERKYVEKQNIDGKEIECIDLQLTDSEIFETTTKKVFGNEKNKLVIQPLGIIVIEFLLNKFDIFFNYDYTKQMEDNLDLISKGEIEYTKICEDCYNELITIINTLQGLKKFNIKIDEEHSLIVGKNGPVVKRTIANTKDVSFLPVKKNLDIDALKSNSTITLSDVVELKNIVEPIGKYKGVDLFVKTGKYGLYAQWGTETKSLKDEFSLDRIEYIDIIRFLDKDTILDPTKPIGFVRELSKTLSIRTGKKGGDYIFYKKPRAKAPQFFKLSGFNNDYKKCDKQLLLDWIKQTYNVE